MRYLYNLVAPKIGKKLCSKVKQLTKITNEELKDDGVSFIKAISLFSDFLGDGVLMTWSDSDLHALIENYSYYTGRKKKTKRKEKKKKQKKKKNR